MPKQVHILIVIFCLGGIFFILTTRGISKKEENSFFKLIPIGLRDKVYLFPDNPYTEIKASIGRHFFYDRRLSFNQTRSCASCHDPKFSFTDGYRRSVGANGDQVQRNSSALINLVFLKYLTASDSSLHFPEQQINNPMFHTDPVELGWKGNEMEILERLKQDEFYGKNMKMIFPDEKDPFTIKNIQYCLASFVKTIISLNSPYDHYLAGSRDLSEQEKLGMSLFFSSRLNCSKCHGGINFSTPSDTDSSGSVVHYFNTGIFNDRASGDYPNKDQGLFEKTELRTDLGKYRVPTLRNLAFTAPYFHDGSANTLEEVISIYEQRGRNILNGQLTAVERKALISFLFTLSDSTVINNQSYGNPFNEDETKR